MAPRFVAGGLHILVPEILKFAASCNPGKVSPIFFRDLPGIFHPNKTMFCIFAVFPVFCSMPAVDPHVPHILWIEYEENWDDWLCQGLVWVGHTPRGSCNNTLLKRVLRRFFKGGAS